MSEIDARQPGKVRHTLGDLLGQRIFGIACETDPACHTMPTASPTIPFTSCCSIRDLGGRRRARLATDDLAV